MTIKSIRFLGQTFLVVISFLEMNSGLDDKSNIMIKLKDTEKQIQFSRKYPDDQCAEAKSSQELLRKTCLECSLACLSEPGCEAFEFVHGVCRLFDVIVESIKKMKTEEGCRHFSIQKKTMRCPTSFHQYGRHCYYFSNITDPNTYRDWRTAGEECERMEATRVSIETEEEQRILKTIWKGLTELHITNVNGFWTDGKKDAGRGVEWLWQTTKAPFTYTNWIPSVVDDTEQCCMLHVLASGDGHTSLELQWHDYTCDAQYFMGYVCEKKI